MIDNLQSVSDGLAQLMEPMMKIKNKVIKKKLVGIFQGCQTNTSGLIKILREEMSKGGNISNAVIAQLNDLAYKGVSNSNLGKMLDKRAVKNKDFYEKLDKEIVEVRKKFNMDKIEKKYRELSDLIGNCPLTVCDTIEAVDNCDCMAIGLSVRRPEAAIADPSRLIIDDIFPTYVSGEGFLDSAKFKLENSGTDSIGGFKGR